LAYAVHVQVGGKLAQVGSRLIDGVARKMAGDFFGCFAAAMAPEQPAPGTAEVAAGEEAPTAPAAEPEQVAVATPPPLPLPRPSARLPPAVWVTGLAVIIIVLLYFFTR
jgi:hypothetical protein